MATMINSGVATSVASTFSMRRFAAYFKLYAYSNMRKLMLCAGLIFLATFASELFTFFVNREIYNSDSFTPGFDVLAEVNVYIMRFFIVMFSTVAGYMMFSSVRSKDSLIRMYEVPASQFEKFLTVWTIYVPIFLLVTFAAFYLSDVCRVAVVKVFTSYGDCVYVMDLTSVFSLTIDMPGVINAETNFLLSATLYYGIFSLNSVFALGGIFFRRYGYQKTGVFGFLYFMLWSMFFNLGSGFFFDDESWTCLRFTDENMVAWCIISLTVVQSVLVYMLSYARFKETEIVNRW